MLTLMENPLWWWWDNIPLEKLLLSSKPTKKFVHFLLHNYRYILEQEYPGMRIGPEPTTDTFHIIDYGELVPQTILYINLPIKRWTWKDSWKCSGNGHKETIYTIETIWRIIFDQVLNLQISDHRKLTCKFRFECSTARSSVLDSLYMLDTPGT